MAPTKYYLIQQPRSLASMATQTLASWIASQPERLLTPSLELLHQDATKAEHLISRQIEINRNYLYSNLPKKFYDSLAIEVIRALLRLQKGLNSQTRDIMMADNQTKVIGRMIEALFTNKLTSLSYSWENQAFSLDTVFSKPFMLTGLSSLKLIANHVNESDSIRILKELHNLKHLTISNCTHKVIKCIAENCQLLEDMESYHDKGLNETSVNLLLQLPNLKHVTLMFSAINQKGIETLLLSKKIETKLTSMGLCYRNAECVTLLDRVVSLEEHAEKRFNLKYYSNRPETTLNQLYFLVIMCPFIEEVKLDTYHAQKITHIIHLTELQSLRKLTLTGFYFYGNRIMDFLDFRKCNLTHLHLNEVSEINLDALICISRTCPNLEMLSLLECSFKELPVVSRPHTLRTDSPQFRKLEILSLKKNLRTRVPDEQLYFLLSSCPNIKFIKLNTYRFPITDEFMFRVLDRNPMIFLKEFKIMFNYIEDSVAQDQLRPTMLFVNRIIQNCTNHPEIILT